MMRRLAIYKSGAVQIRVSGAYPERFINCCIAARLELWGIKWRGSCMMVWLALPDFFQIRPAARKSGVRIRVTRRYGFPFLFHRWKKRKVLLAGVAFFFIALYWLSGYIWFVEVQGVSAAQVQRLAQLAAAHGLYVGARLETIDRKILEKSLLLEAPELAWAGVRFEGTKAVLEVVEKVRTQPKERAVGNLVAAKAGTITECIVIQGESAVEAGDAVEEGDLLIRSAAAQAEGIVKAKIVYESIGEAPLRQRVYARTGRMAYGAALRCGDHRFAWREPVFTDFPAHEEEQVVKRTLQWRNRNFTVELDINAYRELTAYWEERSAAEARQSAVLQAESRISLPEDAYVLERQAELLESGDPNVVKVRLLLITEEEIGKYIQYSGE